jgi:hypothetical protein
MGRCGSQSERQEVTVEDLSEELAEVDGIVVGDDGTPRFTMEVVDNSGRQTELQE